MGNASSKLPSLIRALRHYTNDVRAANTERLEVRHGWTMVAQPAEGRRFTNAMAGILAWALESNAFTFKFTDQYIEMRPRRRAAMQQIIVSAENVL